MLDLTLLNMAIIPIKTFQFSQIERDDFKAGFTDPPASDYGAARNKTNLLPLTTEPQQRQTG